MRSIASVLSRRCSRGVLIVYSVRLPLGDVAVARRGRYIRSYRERSLRFARAPIGAPLRLYVR